MYTIQPKKLLIINILDILQKYTDEEHKLSQKQIENILSEKYMMSVDRKSIRRNLINLIESEYINIGYTEKKRVIKNKKNGEEEENIILTDFYLIRELTNGELRYLIDSILSSKHIPEKHGKELIEKIELLGGSYFHSHTKNISRKTGSVVYSQEVFYNIEQLDIAINQHKKVKFKYTYFGEDKKSHVRCRNDGSVREYIINPYQMAVNEGKYYLICNNDKYDDISHYRIDRIRDVEVLEDSVKPFKNLKEITDHKLDLNKYMDEHIYMFSGKQSMVKFKVVKEMIGDVADVFGTGFTVHGSDADYFIVSTKVNENAMIQYAKSFAPDVIIIEPRDLAIKVKKQLEEAILQYDK